MILNLEVENERSREGGLVVLIVFARKEGIYIL